MKGTRYWSWREKKRKKRTKRTQPQWYSLLWFHHRRVDSIWVRIIKDCLSFSRREKHQLQIPPIPSTRSRSSPLPVTLSRLSLLPGQYLSGPNYSPPPRGKTGKTWRHHWIVSTSPPDFPTPLSSPLVSSFSSSSSLPSSHCSPRVYVCSVLPSASQGMSPQLFSDLLSFSLVPFFFPSFEALCVRATEQTSHFETNEEEEEEGFLGYAFSFAVVVVSPLLWTRKR